MPNAHFFSGHDRSADHRGRPPAGGESIGRRPAPKARSSYDDTSPEQVFWEVGLVIATPLALAVSIALILRACGVT